MADAAQPRRARIVPVSCTAALFRLGVQLRQHLHQVTSVHRLDHVGVEPGLFRAAAVVLLAPARYGDKSEVLAPRLLSNVAAGVVAVEFRPSDSGSGPVIRSSRPVRKPENRS